MRAKNPVLCNQGFIPQEKFLVHGPDNVRQQPRYLRFFIQTHHHIPPMFSMDSDYLTMREHPEPHEQDPNARTQDQGHSPYLCQNAAAEACVLFA